MRLPQALRPLPGFRQRLVPVLGWTAAIAAGLAVAYVLDEMHVQQSGGLGTVLVTIAVVFIGGGLTLVVGAALLFGAYLLWPLTLILTVLGGFMGSGVGALIGASVAGAIGLAVAWLNRDNPDLQTT